MSFEDKYSWKILTQFSSVVESYYRLGLMDANKSQDVKAVNEIIDYRYVTNAVNKFYKTPSIFSREEKFDF